MTDEQKQIRQWMIAFGQECPDKPEIPSLETRMLRAKLILEEALETIQALGFLIPIHKWEDLDSVGILEPNLKEIADGCEDIKVVTDGTLAACGLLDEGCVRDIDGKIVHFGPDLDPLFNEVMESNWSKMWTYKEAVSSTATGLTCKCTKPEYGPEEKIWLVTDSNGKVIKSPSYSPANLQPIIDSYSK